MALIKCPECGGTISDKSVQCIHCGFPMPNNERKREICVINGSEFDFTDLVDEITESYRRDGDVNQYGLFAHTLYHSVRIISMDEAVGIVNYIRENGHVQPSLTTASFYRNQVRCPKCLSTQITSSARGVNMTWGLIGASKTVNRCAKCGHTWKPKR